MTPEPVLPVLPVAPVDGPGLGHATMVPQPNLPAAHPTLQQDQATGPVTTSREQSMEVNDAPASVVTTPPQQLMVIDGPDGSSAVGNPTTPVEESVEKDPTTPEKNHQPPVAATPSQPATTVQDNSEVSTVEASTMCRDELEAEIPTTLKRARSPSPEPPTNPHDASKALFIFQQEYVFLNMVETLKNSLKGSLERCGMRLGAKAAFHINFEPDVNHIRSEAMRPTATLHEIADAVELAMLTPWTDRCSRLITKYRLEMRKDLVVEARKAALKVKEKVLAKAEFVGPGDPLLPPSPPTFARARPHLIPQSPRHPRTPSPSHTPLRPQTPLRIRPPTSIPSTPVPSTRRHAPRPTPRRPTPLNNNRQASTSVVDALGPGMANLNIQDCIHVALPSTSAAGTTTPRGNQRRRVVLVVSQEEEEEAVSTPRRRRRNQRPGTPARPRMANPTPTARSSAAVVGHIGRYAMTTPAPGSAAAETDGDIVVPDAGDDVFVSDD
ncbi:hypothetical protein F4677DRAFT_442662 [Hypoxylon crocopeplum]|nr:hypothetical protein F4677DRAFT_442662 [Hypoxylon crocopeplum]